MHPKVRIPCSILSDLFGRFFCWFGVSLPAHTTRIGGNRELVSVLKDFCVFLRMLIEFGDFQKSADTEFQLVFESFSELYCDV